MSPKDRASLEPFESPEELEAAASDMPALIRPFALFAAYLGQTRQMLQALHEGVDLSARVMEAAASVTRDPRAGGWLHSAERQREILASGFPVANGHALVGVWGAFEAWSQDLAAAWIRCGGFEGDADGLVALAERCGTAVPVAALIRDGQEAIADAMLKMLETVARLASGLGSVEARLGPIGLSVPVEKGIRDQLYYAEKTRHLYAHRAGLADAKFLAECPGLGAIEGQRVNVSAETLEKYLEAFRTYVMTVLDAVVPLAKRMEQERNGE